VNAAGATVWHPLGDMFDGVVVRFYPEAEAILEKLPRRGFPMILREIKTRKGTAFKPYSYSSFEKLNQNLRKKTSTFRAISRSMRAWWNDRT
jgi:hypothetical protein